MNWIPNSFRRRKLYDDLSHEMRLHLEERVEHLIGEGLSPQEAQRQARVAFGNLAMLEERSREVWQWPTLESIWADVRFAFRQLRKSPGFAFAAVATLALAIGANTVVFAVLNALVLRPLNVPAAKSIYIVGHAHSIWGYESYPNYLDLRDRNRSFDALAADNITQAGLDTGKNPSQAFLIEASGNYFDVLGLQPYLGRFFHAADEHGPNSAPYVVLSYAGWREHFEGDRGVVGRTVLLNKHPFVIIGVAPPGFVGTFIAFSPELFVPVNSGLESDGLLNQRANRWMSELVGRLKPGVTPAQADADLDAIGSWLGKTYPDVEDPNLLTFKLQRPGIASAFGGAIKTFLAGLMLLAGLILLAACANLGSLFAARAADRSREVALRLALGARRARILRQLLTEAILLSLAGGAAGLWGSVILLRAISAWRPFPEFPMNLPLNPDANVYALALLLAVVSGLLFGIVPVRQVLGTDPYQVIKSASAGSPSVARGGRLNLRDVLLVTQIAVCAVLVTSSIVAVRGLVRSMHTRLGIDPHNTLLVDTDPHMAGYKDSQVPALHRRMIDALKALPGVAQVGLVSSPPLKMGWDDVNIFTDETSDLRPSNAAADAIFFSVSPEYFQAAGTALLKGRVFTWNDDESAPHVAVINQEFARRLFGSPVTAMGRHFRTKEGGRIEVVGVVEDGKYTANVAEAPQNAIFVPILQSPRSDTWLVVRSGSSSPLLGAAVRSKLHDLDPGLPCFIQRWSEEMNGAFFASRMAAFSLGVLGLMGAILSITGIFGMAAYSVSKRIKELGIRVALGARRKEVLQAALGRAFKLLAIGSAAGLGLGILATHVLAFIVYQATPRDPVVLAGAVVAMALLGLVATWIPAQRALSVNPLVLLREE
jgi:macrolide transport system ATP-binding/permease protein